MPISTACTDCRRRYTVKSEMAGKRFRCKDCEAIVIVPEAALDQDDDDPFAGEELKSTGRPIRQYDDDEDDDVETTGRERRIRREPKPVKKKKTRRPSIPTAVVVALVLQCVLVGFLALGSLGSFVQIANKEEGANAGGLIGITGRFAIALIVLIGLFQRKHSARQWSRGLCIFGDICGGLIILVMALVGSNNPDAMLTIGVMLTQCVAWTTIIVCLSTDGADDWFVE